MGVIAHDPAMLALVAADSAVSELGTGFHFTEGPVWHPDQRWLVFSDIPSNRLHRWLPSGELAVFREPSNMANGKVMISGLAINPSANAAATQR